MQSFNWNDLKYLIALHRSETLLAAARHLGTSDTTVARRIADLQDKLGVTLFLRDTAGRYVLTEIRHAILIQAETTERAAMAVEDLLGHIDDPPDRCGADQFRSRDHQPDSGAADQQATGSGARSDAGAYPRGAAA
ncbi:LysR family transcriptional regulator [Roseobacter sp.]|uniref:helix-turn-helix domain-containing protein n=1 Tax=Roseobacter sp. TaxID=1907202 RepID=UPI00296685A5|nr:LysR family transcriptional regulator [Roseobacter sp.]MDW3182804.1 LysR family transcriptional regulator [Roseobacter sp.]